jgi:hypothetical protein
MRDREDNISRRDQLSDDFDLPKASLREKPVRLFDRIELIDRRRETSNRVLVFARSEGKHKSAQ